VPSDVTATLDQALAAFGLDHVNVRQRPRLSATDRVTSRTIWQRGSRARTCSTCAARRTILRPRARSSGWHQTLKNRILLDNYYLAGDLERQIGLFIEHYNHARYHESIDNVTLPTFTSADLRRSLPNANVSSATPSQTAACSTDCRPLKL
jgi:RNA-directed DNA polymerase